MNSIQCEELSNIVQCSSSHLIYTTKLIKPQIKCDAFATQLADQLKSTSVASLCGPRVASINSLLGARNSQMSKCGCCPPTPKLNRMNTNNTQQHLPQAIPHLLATHVGLAEPKMEYPSSVLIRLRIYNILWLWVMAPGYQPMDLEGQVTWSRTPGFEPSP